MSRVIILDTGPLGHYSLTARQKSTSFLSEREGSRPGVSRIGNIVGYLADSLQEITIAYHSPIR